MGPVDFLLHVLNFILPAFGVACIAAGLAKLLWRKELRAVAWWRLAGWASLAGVLVLVAGLVVLGRDGRMATYGALVLADALTLWWLGLRRA